MSFDAASFKDAEQAIAPAISLISTGLRLPLGKVINHGDSGGLEASSFIAVSGFQCNAADGRR